MTIEKKRTAEFRRHRQLLAALYIGAASLGLILMVASVVRGLFFHTGTAKSTLSVVADNPGPPELLACHKMVVEQLTTLSTTTQQLFQRPLKGTDEQFAEWKSDWKRFSTQWQDQWSVVNARCRFSELAEQKLGVAYNQMAQVHKALPTMRLRYNSLLAEFDTAQADELFEMRHTLDDSLASITRKLEAMPASSDSDPSDSLESTAASVNSVKAAQ